MKSLTFTLIFTLAILNIASLADASSLHNSNRILKKRTPIHLRRQAQNNPGLGIINVGPTPSVASQDPAPTSPSVTAAAATDTTSVTTTASSVSTTTKTQRGGLIPGVVDTLLGTGTTTSTTEAPTTSTSVTPTTSSTPTTSLTSSTAQSSVIPETLSSPVVTDAPPVVIATPPPTLTTFSTVTGAAAAQESAEVPPPSGSTSRFTRNTIIIIVAIAGSIGAVALIWTIIRKWKFSPSSSFEERMQPIDWQPTPDDAFASHRARPTSHGSFGSADYHNHLESRSQHGHNDLVADLPPHDLLSGAGSNQVGGGYTDMHRGPSPPMTEGVQRGPSINRGGQYDRYHDAYDYNGGAATRGY